MHYRVQLRDTDRVLVAEDVVRGKKFAVQRARVMLNLYKGPCFVELRVENQWCQASSTVTWTEGKST